MASTSPKLLLRKPAGTDTVNVVSDLSDNFDKIDLASGEKRRYRKADGNMSLANNVTNPITGAGTTLAELTLKAVVNDWIEVGINALWGGEAFQGYIDVWTKIAGTPVNSWGGNLWSAPTAGHQGLVGWRGEASVTSCLSGTAIRQVVAGDIDGSGQVTAGPYGSGGGGVKTIYAVSTIPFLWHMINHGQL